MAPVGIRQHVQFVTCGTWYFPQSSQHDLQAEDTIANSLLWVLECFLDHMHTVAILDLCRGRELDGLLKGPSHEPLKKHQEGHDAWVYMIAHCIYLHAQNIFQMHAFSISVARIMYSKGMGNQIFFFILGKLTFTYCTFGHIMKKSSLITIWLWI